MINFTFVGDISFNDLGDLYSPYSSRFKGIFKENDFVIGNLEALASVGEFNFLKNPRVTTSLESLNHLRDMGINLVTLAHNHVFDAGLSGFLATIRKLEELNIAFIGAGLTRDDASRPFIYKHRDFKIGILNYCTEDTNPSLPRNCEVFLNIYETSKIVSDIKILKESCQKVVLILHWGGKFEGGYFPDKYQYKDAISFVEAGASLIVGHHPHTLQPCYKINETPIYFSLGNFIFFDIKHNDTVIRLSPRRKKGGILMACFSASNQILDTLMFTSFSNNHLKLFKINWAFSIRQFIFDKFYNFSFFWSIYKFQFRYINPFFYFLFIQDGGYKKFRNLNFNKIKRFLWKK